MNHTTETTAAHAAPISPWSTRSSEGAQMLAELCRLDEAGLRDTAAYSDLLEAIQADEFVTQAARKAAGEALREGISVADLCVCEMRPCTCREEQAAEKPDLADRAMGRVHKVYSQIAYLACLRDLDDRDELVANLLRAVAAVECDVDELGGHYRARRVEATEERSDVAPPRSGPREIGTASPITKAV